MTHAARALQSHALLEEGINLWITYILFWPHKDMEGLPRWGIISMPGPSPRQHKHERRYTPGTHSFIPTRRIWNDDYGGELIFGDFVSLKFPDISLTGEEEPQKGNLTQESSSNWGSNPGPLRDRCTCYHLFHSGGLGVQTWENKMLQQNELPTPQKNFWKLWIYRPEYVRHGIQRVKKSISLFHVLQLSIFQYWHCDASRNQICSMYS